jgi:hypothetical protein
MQLWRWTRISARLSSAAAAILLGCMPGDGGGSTSGPLGALLATPASAAALPRPDEQMPQKKRQIHHVIPLARPLKWDRTALVKFNEGPFPYDGMIPDTDAPFLNISSGDKKGHQNTTGSVLWEKEVFRDRQTLLHLPKGFDINRPGVIVVFFHGHGATLQRDVIERQRVPAQVSASGINAVLVAPQFALDAVDSSAGKFWEPGGFGRFLDEAASRLAHLHGDPDPDLAAKFAAMPIVIVAYSGGYSAAAWSIARGGVENRIRGVILLDALYGELDKFSSWIAQSPSAFFVSAYTGSTKAQNDELARSLAERNVAYGTTLKRPDWRNGVTFLSADVDHRDFVQRSWVDDPIKNVLASLNEYRRH